MTTPTRLCAYKLTCVVQQNATLFNNNNNNIFYRASIKILYSSKYSKICVQQFTYFLSLHYDYTHKTCMFIQNDNFIITLYLCIRNYYYDEVLNLCIKRAAEAKST